MKIYPSVLATWMILAVDNVWVSTKNDGKQQKIHHVIYTTDTNPNHSFILLLIFAHFLVFF